MELVEHSFISVSFSRVHPLLHMVVLRVGTESGLPFGAELTRKWSPKQVDPFDFERIREIQINSSLRFVIRINVARHVQFEMFGLSDS